MTGKNPTLAELGLDLAAIRKYELDLRAGTVKTDGSAADHAAAMAAIDKIGKIPGGWPPKPDSPLAQELAEMRVARAADASTSTTGSPLIPSRSLASVAASWIAERKVKNKPHTVYAKECHYGNFIEHLAAVADKSAFDKAEFSAFKKREQGAAQERAEAEGKQFRKLPERELAGMFIATKTSMSSLGKQHPVDFKAAMLKQSQKAKTVDNKLLTLSDFFEYAIGNGAYKPADDANPVAGTLILPKKEHIDKLSWPINLVELTLSSQSC